MIVIQDNLVANGNSVTEEFSIPNGAVRKKVPCMRPPAEEVL